MRLTVIFWLPSLIFEWEKISLKRVTLCYGMCFENNLIKKKIK